MLCSRNVAAVSLLKLSAAAIAALFVLKKSYFFHQKHIKRNQSWQYNINPSLYNLNTNPPSQCAAENEEDIISQLPDDILISIISLMPVKCGIKTSILSKRWRNLYRYVSKINLNCELLGYRNCDFKLPANKGRVEDYKFHESNSVIDSAIRFLRLRSGSRIHSINLSCCFYELTPDQCNEFFCTLRSLGVEKLALSCGCYIRASDIKLSFYHLSEITSLKYLKLSLCTFVPTFKTHYSSLQNLWLYEVNLQYGSIDSILSNCLGLQSLRIDSCICPSKLSFKGPNLQLKNLHINNCGYSVDNIEIYASNLTLFEFSNPGIVSFTFDHVPLLRSVYLYAYKKNFVPYAALGLAKDVPHLKSLTFETRGDYFQGSIIRSMGVNMFNDLRRLDLILYSEPQIDLHLVTAFFHGCPFLEEFHLNASFVEYTEPRWKNQSIIAHSELKKMEFSGFVGTENEIEFASYILKSAMRLEKMVISRCLKKYTGSARWRSRSEAPWSEEMLRKIHRRLHGQAISKTAEIVVQHHTTAHVEDDEWGGDCKIFA